LPNNNNNNNNVVVVIMSKVDQFRVPAAVACRSTRRPTCEPKRDQCEEMKPQPVVEVDPYACGPKGTPLYKKLLVEFFGTLFLVHFGTLVAAQAIAVGDTSLAGGLAVSVVFGGILAGLIGTIGQVSGGHFNPWVTLNFTILGEIGFVEAIGYVIVQFVGAVVGSAVVRAMLGGIVGNLGGVALAAGVTNWQGVLIEAVATFLLLTIINAAVYTKGGSKAAAIYIGMALTILLVSIGGLTGGGINFFRCIATWLVADATFPAEWWVYLVGQGIAAIAAPFAYLFLLHE
jgi:glycerol uptake facilitator-like aquaporin